MLLDGFSQNENHMKALLGYLQTEETDTVRDGFFCRILISIIKNNEFSQWNQAMPADEFVDGFDDSLQKLFGLIFIMFGVDPCVCLWPSGMSVGDVWGPVRVF